MNNAGGEAVDFRAFWGKARPIEGSTVAVHPLPWHGLDVAAAFAGICRLWPDQADELAAAFDGPKEQTLQALCALVALHDIGKFAKTFQAKVKDAYPAGLGDWTASTGCDHPAIGYALLEGERYLMPEAQALIGIYNDISREAVFIPVLGHHGRPITCGRNLPDHVGSPSGAIVRAARAYLQAVMEIFSAPSLPPLRGNRAVLSWRLAGLVALADWIGSDQSHFHYTPATLEPSEYWRAYAQPRARQALAVSGLAPAKPSRRPSLEIICRPEFSPTDSQIWANTIPLSAGPGLFIIEDVMGSGKTEAALILAHRLMQAGQAAGLYVALPTMATANALYQRVADLYRALFDATAQPSLILAHGARDLNDGFLRSLAFGDADASPEAGYGGEASDETASAACTRWLADDRRKTFLADVGIGTIDQALLAILPVKHACVRQVGLARRVLIIDEAHAYDSYMQREVEALVTHQAAMGAPVIILSATLPRLIRQRLAAAYAKGVGCPAAGLSGTAYPLATAVGTTAVEQEMRVRSDLARDITLTRLPSAEEAETLIVSAAQRGAAVAYIRNTVDDAVATAKRLEAAGVSVDLFHARFAMGDRLNIETRVVSRFGWKGTPSDRRGRVLVGTQVLEQSLDFDVDLMVTDLAPVDLILQRAGRLWRHRREGRGWARPELALVSPEPVEAAGADWFAAMFPIGRWVYPNHALLWLGAKHLLARPVIRIPEDVRRLVDAVYDDHALAAAPEPLARISNPAMGEEKAGRTLAGLNVLDLRQGYVPQSGGWGADTKTPTRLGDDRLLLRLTRVGNGRLSPWFADADPRRAWALSELSVSRSRFQGRAGLPTEVEALAAALDAKWEDAGIAAIAVPLLADGDGTRFGYLGRGGAGFGAYSDAYGLSWH